MTDLLKLILGLLASLFKSRANLEAEVLILRQQINVLRRRMPYPTNFVLAVEQSNPTAARSLVDSKVA